MNDRNIEHLHPDLKPLCLMWLAKCKEQQINAEIIFTWRSVAEQDALYAQGRTAPGKIVTNARGGQSAHNITLFDGTPASRAFDFVIVNDDGTANWNPDSPQWRAAVAIGKQLGLVWGGDWHSIKDYDHFELPA